MTHPSDDARTAVHEILTAYRLMTARHQIALNALCDVDGVEDANEEEYQELEREQGHETAEQVAAFMARLTELFGLPEDRPVAVLGANGAQYDVNPGRINDTARTAFTRGQCHALARALSDQTGWPTAAVIEPDCSYDYDACGAGIQLADGVCICQLVHVMAVRPDGMLVDIDGLTAPEEVRDSGEHTPVPMTEAMWRMIEDSPAWRPADMLVARTFVQPLLATLTAPAVQMEIAA
ncbi:hypothetical protein [Streptomyces sp. NBC_01304]|uniref:hypothetical protein n=1 Tax=Streptomyces sp. NBC_01304 TaxID=2903818 RepID=UPI002E0E1FA7|nr:hypothetical protein OG430_48330 [Streptomyces sp. NBC_01304]